MPCRPEPARAWRNWQTRRTQNPVLATECRFDPDRPHQRPLASPVAGSTDASNPNLLIRGGLQWDKSWQRDERIVVITVGVALLVLPMKGTTRWPTGSAALVIFQHAWQTGIALTPIDNPFKGINIDAAATVLKATMGPVLIRAGRCVRSPALFADRRHLLADVVTSRAVALGVTCHACATQGA